MSERGYELAKNEGENNLIEGLALNEVANTIDITEYQDEALKALENVPAWNEITSNPDILTELEVDTTYIFLKRVAANNERPLIDRMETINIFYNNADETAAIFNYKYPLELIETLLQTAEPHRTTKTTKTANITELKKLILKNGSSTGQIKIKINMSSSYTDQNEIYIYINYVYDNQNILRWYIEPEFNIYDEYGETMKGLEKSELDALFKVELFKLEATRTAEEIETQKQKIAGNDPLIQSLFMDYYFNIEYYIITEK